MNGSSSSLLDQLPQRLRTTQVAARPDLQVSRHLYRGRAWYVLYDPVSFRSHRLSVTDYQILTSLRDDQTLQTTFRQLVERGLLSPEDEPAFYRFVVRLQQLNLLTLPITNGRQLYQRYQLRQKMQSSSWVTRLLFLRISLVNPNAFLNRTMRLAQPLFSRAFLLAWCAALLAAGTILLLRWNDFLTPWNEMLAGQNLVLIWGTLLGLKVWHELGHAYACKHFGGDVPDMGMILFLGNPLAYMDASAAWSFPEKHQRIMVSLGGMYFESIAAVLGVFVWALAGDPYIQAIAHHVVVLAGLVTLLFNANPLMRYDGYYVLSDLLGIPNLRALALEELRHVGKRWFLGLPSSPRPTSVPMRAFLIAFGIGSTVYRTVVILTISLLVASQFFLIGMVLAGSHLITTFGGGLVKLCRYLWKADEVPQPRGYAVSAALLAGLAILFLFIPVGKNVRLQGTLRRQHEQIVRAAVPGQIQQIMAHSGQAVVAQAPLVQLENQELDEAVLLLEAQLQQARTAMAIHQTTDRVQAAQDAMRIQRLQDELTVARSRQAALRVVAPQDGQVITCLASYDTTRHVATGTPLATVVRGAPIIRCYGRAEDLATTRPQPGQTVRCRFVAQPSRIFTGQIAQVAPAAHSRLEDLALTQLGGGTVVVDPTTLQSPEPIFEVQVVLDQAPPAELRHGSSVLVQLSRRSESLGQYLYRRLRVFWNQVAIR